MDKKNSAAWRALEKARSKSPTPNHPPNTSLSDPVQISPEKRFNNLLDFLNLSSIPHDFNPEETCLPFLASPEHRRYFMTVLKLIAIKIMESGIFFKGGLKGNIPSHNPTIYDPYPIENIDQFIFGLASVLHRHEMGKEYPSGDQWFTFAEAERKLKLFISGVEIWKGKRPAQPLKTLLNKLKALAWETEAKPDDFEPTSLEIFARETAIRWNVDVEIDKTSKGARLTTKKEIAGIFVKHIKAPGTVISDRVEELLNLFGIEAKSETIRKKLPKKQQTT
jgi:hypothetical protein